MKCNWSNELEWSKEERGNVKLDSWVFELRSRVGDEATEWRGGEEW